MLTLLGSSAVYGLGAGASSGDRPQSDGRAGRSDGGDRSDTAGRPTVADGSILESGRDGRTRFTLLHTNDEHSHLIPFPLVNDHPERNGTALGGFARLAGAIAEVREQKQAAGEDVLLLSAGDLISGPPFGWLPIEGVAPELKLMQSIGYDAAVVGNHEFDYGPATLADYYAAGGYPEAHENMAVLGTNVNAPSEHGLDDVGLLPTTTIELQDGTTIGLFGLLGENAIDVILQTDPIDFSDQHGTARETVAELRDDGADIVIALTHSGIEEDVDLAGSVDDIDLIVGGHSHTVLEEPRVEDGTPIVQAGAHLNYLGRLELAYDDGSETLEFLNDRDGVDFLHPLDAGVSPDTDVLEMVSTYEDQLHDYVSDITRGEYPRFDEVQMYSDVSVSRGPPRTESALGNFITDAIRLETAEFLGERVDFAFYPDGMIRERLAAGEHEWAKDEVLFYDLVTVNALGEGYDDRPGYPVVSFWLTADEIIRAMESSILLTEVLGSSYFLQVSGGRFEFDPGRATWGTVPIIDLPLPAFRAILSAERYVGDGVQESDSYESLDGGDRLYRVATDYYLGSQIPQVGEIVSQLEVTPKDEDGSEIALEDAIVQREDGRELKAWETVLDYANNQPADADGNPRLSERYHEPDGRLVETSGLPLVLTPAAGAAAAGVVGYGMHRWGRTGPLGFDDSGDEPS